MHVWFAKFCWLHISPIIILALGSSLTVPVVLEGCISRTQIKVLHVKLLLVSVSVCVVHCFDTDPEDHVDMHGSGDEGDKSFDHVTDSNMEEART